MLQLSGYNHRPHNYVQLTFLKKVGYKWSAKQVWLNFAKFGPTRIAGTSNGRQMFTTFKEVKYFKNQTHICQDDKYIALGFVLFDFDCVHCDLNSHVNWSGLNSRVRGVGVGVTLALRNALSHVVHSNPQQLGRIWSLGWSLPILVHPPVLSQTQIYLNLEVPLWPSLEFGPFNLRVSFKMCVYDKNITIDCLVICLIDLPVLTCSRTSKHINDISAQQIVLCNPKALQERSSSWELWIARMNPPKYL